MHSCEHGHDTPLKYCAICLREQIGHINESYKEQDKKLCEATKRIIELESSIKEHYECFLGEPRRSDLELWACVGKTPEPAGNEKTIYFAEYCESTIVGKERWIGPNIKFPTKGAAERYNMLYQPGHKTRVVVES